MQPTSLLAGVRDLLLHLDPATTAILHASPSSTALIGTAPADLLGQPLSTLIHPDDFHVFASEMHDATYSITFRFHVRILSAVAISGFAAFELHGSLHPAGGYLAMSARPLLLKHTADFDSFLHLKTEQMMLLRQIQELRDEALAEAVATPPPPSPATTATTPSPHPATGGAREVMGDLGIFFVPKPADAPLKRRPKANRPIERCCQWCGATSAPEWRRGPSGPKTLCNACGLRHSKVGKKRRSRSVSTTTTTSETGSRS
ncbi:Cutinase gene palindrome-binding protein [Lasiodiplodia hormozganensis]|uniref:Cutinase gene palindrome-binding protein n=1 Tax=Lasiodiplodia hormozganensis TaxID=869390 RepID=A0AA39U268_9PEZI|nr:Cutinase gene palindrome-binding protein [Lasiodiplodia hormozganensis]